MLARSLLISVTLFTCTLSSLGCKTAKKVAEIRPPSNKNALCSAALELVRTELDPASLKRTRLVASDDYVGDFHQLRLEAAELAETSDGILFYKIEPLGGKGTRFKGTSIELGLTIPILEEGTYNIFGASCVDSDRVPRILRARMQEEPTESSAGYFAGADVFCGPLVAASDPSGRKKPFLQRSNSNHEVASLLIAGFESRERIKARSFKTHNESAIYYAAHKDEPNQSEGALQLVDLTNQITRHGKHGYALLVANGFENNLQKTVDSMAAPKQAIPRDSLALAGASSKCRSDDQWENTQSNYTPSVDFTKGLGYDDPFGTQVEPTEPETQLEAPTVSEKPASQDNKSGGAKATSKTGAHGEENSVLKGAGVAMIASGSVILTGGLTALGLRELRKHLQAKAKLTRADFDYGVKLNSLSKRVAAAPAEAEALKQLTQVRADFLKEQHRIEMIAYKESLLTEKAELETIKQRLGDIFPAKSMERLAKIETKLGGFIGTGPYADFPDEKTLLQTTKPAISGADGDTDLDSKIAQRLENRWDLLEKTYQMNRGKSEAEVKDFAKGIQSETKGVSDLRQQAISRTKFFADDLATPRGNMIITGALVVGAIAFLSGIATTSVALSEGVNGEVQFMQSTSEQGLGIVQDLRRIKAIYSTLPDKITYRQ